MPKNEAISQFLDRLREPGDEHGSLPWPEELSDLTAELGSALSQSFAEGRPLLKVSGAEIAAYLDRALDADERETFEAKLLASPELREEVASLAHFMEGLSTSFEPATHEDGSRTGMVGEATIEGVRATFEQKQPLTLIQHEALFRDPALRAEYNRLIRSEHLQRPPFDKGVFSPAVMSMPTQIAASSDKHLKDRSFPGGSIHIGSAGRKNLVQINIQTEGASFAANHLELHGSDGALAYLTLPAPDSTGEITRVVNLENEPDALAVELLRDPRTKGVFISK